MEKSPDVESEIPAHAYLELKSGVSIIDIPATPQQQAQLFVGTSRAGVLFADIRLRAFFGALNGTQMLADFLSNPIFSPAEIQSAAAELLQANLLIARMSANPLSNSFNSENQRICETRLKHEATTASWNEATSQDGRDLVRARVDFPILIFGSSRLATSLFSILQASGFSQVRLLPGQRSLMTTSGKRDNSSRIEIDELCGLNILLSDIGKTREETIFRIRQTAQLFPSAPPRFPQIPRLVISTESAQPDYIQRWMSEAVPHLQISHLNESFIDVGPLVVPGITACLRCVGMRKFGVHKIPALVELLQTLEIAPEISSSGSAFLAGFIAAIAIQYADTGQSPLMKKTLRFNLNDVSNPEHIYWEPHIFCGCLEVI